MIIAVAFLAVIAATLFTVCLRDGAKKQNLLGQIKAEQCITDTFIGEFLRLQLENTDLMNHNQQLYNQRRILKANCHDALSEIRRHCRTISMLTDEVEQLQLELVKRELKTSTLRITPVPDLERA